MKTYIVILLLLGSVIGIDVVAQEFNIDKEIARIRKIEDPKKRVEMMNALKERLSRMNQAQREAAIAKLRRNRKTHVEQMQEHQMHHMESNQKFNQYEAGYNMDQMRNEGMDKNMERNRRQWMER